MANGIDIVIGAEVSGALQGLQKVEAATVKAGATINKLPAAINSTNQALAKIRPGSNEATASLTNLSRVAQDAPYGFIGIANNINPLLESFQRLKASTGTTGGALKALGSSLVGGGGLGLAVGVVSSLLVVFGDKLFGSSKKAKETAEEVERLNKVLKETEKTAGSVKLTAIGDTAGEVAKVQELAKVVQDQTRSYNERNNALIQLKAINKNYFGDLTLESDSLKGLTARVNEYSQALINAQVTKILSEDIGKLSIELSKATNDYNKFSSAFQKAKNSLQQDGDYNDTKTIREYNENLKLLKSQGSILTDLANRKYQLQQLLSQSINEGLKFKPLTVPGTTTVKPDKLEVKPKSVIIDFNQDVTNKQIDNLLKYMFDKSVKFDFIAPELIPPEEAKQQGLTFSQMFGHEVEKYFKQTDPIDFGLNKAVRDFKPPKTFSFKMFEGLSEEQFKLAESAELITNTLAPAFDNLINAIGRGENAFQAFGEGVKQVLVQVISKLVQTALLAAALSLIPGGVGGVKGFGAIFSSLLGLGGARAGGGPVSFGKSYLVGENGPELFVPSNSGRIMNGNQVAAMSYSGGGSSGGGRQIIRGQNIILSYARTNRAQNRLGRG